MVLEVAGLNCGEVGLVHVLDELAHVVGYPHSGQLRGVVRQDGERILQRTSAIAA